MGKLSVRVFTYQAMGEVPDWVKEENIEAWVQSMVSWNGLSLNQLRGISVTKDLIEKSEWERRMRQAEQITREGQSGPKIVS